jgi:antitoxin YefM
MRTTNFTDLRKNLKEYLDSVINDSDTVIINRDGNSGVVIISLDEYNALKESEYIMSSPETMQRIKEGAKSIAEGRGKRIKGVKELNDFADSL